MNKTRLAITTALAALACAAPAQADSIAYVKGGDLWMSTTDGARQYQVTYTGGYSTVSQSDHGSLAALHGDHIRTLDLQGNVLHDIRTPASSSFPGTQFRGPFDPAIAPDGTRIAYSWYFTELSETPSCNPSNGCQATYSRQGTGYTRPDRITAFDDMGYQAQTGWVSPSWTSGSGTILSDPVQVLNEQVVIHTPGDSSVAGGMNRWFNDPDANGLRDVEMSPDKQKLAGISGDKDDSIRFYRAKGGYPTLPDGCYALGGDKGRYQQPSWSPDSSRLAFADDQGIHTLAIPDMKSDCGNPTEESKLLIPGASYPDWGVSEVPPARSAPGNGGGNGGAGGGGGTQQQPGNGTKQPGGGSGQAGGSAAGKLGAVRPAKATRAALRKGLRVKVTTTGPGVVKAALSLKGQRLATGSVKTTGAGTATVRLGKVARKRVARLGGRKLTLTITLGGQTRRQTIKVR